MQYIYKNQAISVKWAIKNHTQVVEDFTDCEVKVFLVGNGDRIPVNAEVDGNVISFDVEKNKLADGIYGVKAIWIRNHFNPPLYAVLPNLFGVTSIAGEATAPTYTKMKINAEAWSVPYLRDGLDSYERAVIIGATNLTEKEWIYNAESVNTRLSEAESRMEADIEQALWVCEQAKDSLNETNEEAKEVIKTIKGGERTGNCTFTKQYGVYISSDVSILSGQKITINSNLVMATLYVGDSDMINIDSFPYTYTATKNATIHVEGDKDESSSANPYMSYKVIESESLITAAQNATTAANTAATGANNVNASLSGNTLSVTNRQGVTTSVNVKGADGKDGGILFPKFTADAEAGTLTISEDNDRITVENGYLVIND